MFSVLLSAQSDVGRAEEFAKQIQKTMGVPFKGDGLQVAIHSNVGIVHFPEHDKDVNTLVQRAGVALRIAQKAIKDYATYEPSFDKQTPLRLTLIPELKHAIEREGLELFYQP